MGGCFSVSMSCDQVVNEVSQWLCLKGSYIHNLAENLASLEKAMGVLKAKRDDVQGRVNREEFTGDRRRLAQVQVWLTNILTLENQHNDLLSISELELQRLCLCGFCSKDLKLSYRFGKRVMMMLREVESLNCQGEFDVVTEIASIAEVEELPFQHTIVGQETMLKTVWNHFMDDKVGIVGLHGMGGVGKTTLLTQINNKFSTRGEGFDLVTWIVVSKHATVRKIQGAIGEKLGLAGKEWEEKNENQRALNIYNVLKKKKFVLLLDDLWEKVNLNVIGVPYPNRENGCKVAFTTRSRDVCGRMEVDDPIEVRCLDTKEAWDLFKRKVGKNTLGSHPDIPKLARKVAEKCRGLPLALNVIGETMACKNTVQEWHQAVDVLTSSAIDFSGVEDYIFPILKYSYDSLYNEEVKSCFLYCSLFPEDYEIEKEKLIEYWIGEGFIDEKKGRERALNQGYEIIGTLVRTCLLIQVEWNLEPSVKMHDVVREMALWIASDLGRNRDKWIVRGGLGLRELPKMEQWKNVTRMSLMGNDIGEEISESLECPQLKTLFLQKNKHLKTISGEFFGSMRQLLVLDLSDNENLSGLPEETSRLVSLRYLDLSGTEIEKLPDGFQEWKMLIHLNLTMTFHLENLDGISNLSSLRTLRLLPSYVFLDLNLMKELEQLEHLELVTTRISASLVGELLYHPNVGRCIQQVHIMQLPEESVTRVLDLSAMYNLCDMYIQNCGMEEKTRWNKNLTSPCFANLYYVKLEMCNGIKDLTWLMFAPNLVNLKVGACKELEDIISKQKATSVGLEGSIVVFEKLETLHLMHLHELKNIYWNALPLQRLREVYIAGCPKLRKLPLDSKSVFNVENLILGCGEKEWMERVEWEDEATRLRFSYKLH